MEKNNQDNSQRRSFLKFGLLAGGATLAGWGINKKLMADTIPPASGQKVKVMTADGKLMEVDRFVDVFQVFVEQIRIIGPTN